MKNIVRIITALVAISFIVSSILFFVRYPERFDVFQQNISEDVSLEDYVVSMSSYSEVAYITPSLPDISNYTLETLKQKTPIYQEGAIEVQALEKGYPVLRSQVAQYGDLQSKLDPISIVIKSGVVSLEDVATFIDDTTLIEQEADRRFLLHVPLVVREAATLIIDQGQTLLMNANTGVMLPVYGGLYVLGSHIMGWDMEQDQPAYYQGEDKFRPYITAWCGSTMNIGKSYLGYLGYNYPKSYGLTYSSCKNDKYVAKDTSLDSGTGWIIESEFEELYFGFYSHETHDAVILRNEYKDNIVYGIDPHDYSKNLIIGHNTVMGSREKHGIIISRGVTDSYIFNNSTEGNAGSGIMLDRDSTKNIVAFNRSVNNGGDGIAFYESSHNISYKNSYSDNQGSGMRVRNSWDIQSYQDVMNDNEQYGVELYTETLKVRDEARDSYVLKAGMMMDSSEIIGNNSGVFKFSDFEEFLLKNPKIYQVKGNIFVGDLKSLPFKTMGSDQILHIQKR